MERFVEGAWVEAAQVEDTGDLAETAAAVSQIGISEEAADRAGLGNAAWDEIEKLFEGNGDEHAAGAVDQGAAADRAVDVPGDVAGAGGSQVVQVAAGPELGSGVDLPDEIAGLVSVDSKGGVKGSRGVLQRLRDRKRVSRGRGNTQTETEIASQEAPKGRKATSGRSVQRVEVAEAAAKPRGPAVKDGTEARQLARAQVGRRTELARLSSKPAPEIISDQAQWVKDLFEAHFRSTRTLELRRMPLGKNGKNRMKMSRADFSIGWLVLLEAVRRDPAIARIKSWNGKTREEQMGWPPVLPTPSNTNS
jgi:hypothetical protein